MNLSVSISILSLILPGIISGSYLRVNPVLREDANDNNETHIDDMLLTHEQIDIINGKKDPENRGISPTWAPLWNYPVPGQPGMVGVI